MLGAGLLAKKAVERGLAQKPWVKTSLAPGSKVVTEYLEALRPRRAARRARLRPGRLRLHDVHRELGAAARGDLGGDRGVEPRRLLGAVGQPQLRGPDPPRGEDELPRFAAAVRRLRARRADGRRPRERPDRPGLGRRGRLPARHLAVAGGGQRRGRVGRRVGDVPEQLRRHAVRGRRQLEGDRHPRGRPLRVAGRLDLRPPRAVLRGDVAGSARGLRAGRGRAHPLPARRLGDHRPHLARGRVQGGHAGRAVPARARRRAQGLQLVRLAARQPRGDDARHVRERAAAQPARAGAPRAASRSTCPTRRR